MKIVVVSSLWIVVLLYVICFVQSQQIGQIAPSPILVIPNPPVMLPISPLPPRIGILPLPPKPKPAPPSTIPKNPVGVAAVGNWTDPATGTINRYYVYQAPGINIGTCYGLPPAAVRNLVPAGEVLNLASIGSETERQAVSTIVKGLKSPFVFALSSAYGVDNVYDINNDKWVSVSGKCQASIPWGDACVGIPKEPNYMDGARLEYCTAMDFRATVLCKPGDGCSDNGKAPFDPTRKCNYDGVYNNFQCTSGTDTALTGCIYESVPYSEATTKFTCIDPGTPGSCGDGTVTALKNGGFELGSYVKTSSSFVFTSVTNGAYGWTVIEGSVAAQSASIYASGSGKWSLLLNPTGTGGVIQQSIALDKANQRTYRLSFQSSAKPGGSAGNIIANILNSAGQVIKTQTYTNAAVPAGAAPVWNTYNLDFVSAPKSQFYTVQFRTANLNTAAASLIDSAKVCAGQIVTQNVACSVPETTIPLYPGWDLFPSASAPRPTLTWSLKGNTFTAQVFLPGETQTRRLGMHFLYDSMDACQKGGVGQYSSFGNLNYQTAQACGALLRQGVTKYGNIIELVKADVFTTKPTTGGATATLVATGVQPGYYSWEFSVRESATGYGVMWQSSPTFGAGLLNMTVCKPASRCAVGSQILGNPNFNRGTYRASYKGPTLTNVGDNKGDYDLVNANIKSPITGWTVTAGQVLWSSTAWSNDVSNPIRSLGLLPMSAISHTFTVPDASAGYSLSFLVKINPWTQNPNVGVIPGLTITITDALDGSPAAPAEYLGVSYLQKDWVRLRYLFAVTPGRTRYLLTMQCGSPEVGLQDISAVNPATFKYGVIISTLRVCRTISPPTRFDYNAICSGQQQYLKNNFFEPKDGQKTVPPLTPVGVGSTRLYPWWVQLNEVDHYYGAWQNPAGSNYTIDMTGTAPRRGGQLQQQFVVSATASTYRLKFALSGNPICGNSDDPKKVKVMVYNPSSVVIATTEFEFSVVGHSVTNMGWVSKEWSFKTVEGITTYTIAFLSLNTASDCGAAIGNVFICGNPSTLPPSYPMICNGDKSATAVANGDFERLLYPAKTGVTEIYPGGTYINSWAVTAGTVEIITNDYWQAASGQYSVDMSGISAGTIAQTVTLTGGVTYTLTFMMAANPGGVQKKDMQLSIYRADSTSFKTTNPPIFTKQFTWVTDPAKQNSKNMGWLLQSVSFPTVRSVRRYIIEFKSLTPGSAGIALDDVRLCAPTTIPPVNNNDDLDSGPAVFTVTADDNYEFYLNGIEQSPTNAASIDRQSGSCKGQPSVLHHF